MERALDAEGKFKVTYRLMIDGAPTYVDLKAVRMPGDRNRVIVGVSNVDEQIRRELSAIPEGAPVTATTFYTTALSQRSILYDLRYASYEHVLETDYVVLSPADEGSCRQYASEGQEDGVEQLRRRLEADGYERISGEGQLLLLYHKSPEKES